MKTLDEVRAQFSGSPFAEDSVALVVFDTIKGQWQFRPIPFDGIGEGFKGGAIIGTPNDVAFWLRHNPECASHMGMVIYIEEGTK